MKFNIKSKRGFTLIELLVVIGILAVLAAIAIPSVAGLIDRANVSSDKTNANEMTNAIERFASEYELYCQDIASGVLKDADNNGTPDDMDSAQGRVFNVTGVKTRSDIETLEVAQDAPITDDMVAIYRDTKYPVNAKTMQLVVQNYTKTSSSTFEPKQSDMHYWYSPDCGIVVVAEPNKTAAELDGYVISGMDAKGNDISGADRDAKWIDLTLNITNNENTEVINHNGIIPDGATYTKADGTVLYAGETFPTISPKDIYTFGDYEYCYEYSWCRYHEDWNYNCPSGCEFCKDVSNGWSVRVIDGGKTQYGTILSNINNKNTTSLLSTFYSCTNLTNTNGITIPSTITTMYSAFYGSGLVDANSLIIPNSQIDMDYAFAFCYQLESEPTIPNAVTSNKSVIFMGCDKIGY